MTDGPELLERLDVVLGDVATLLRDMAAELRAEYGTPKRPTLRLLERADDEEDV